MTLQDSIDALTRRHFFGSAGFSLGTAALASLRAGAADKTPSGKPGPMLETAPGAGLASRHFPSKCKSVIYLHMVGGPPQMDLFDYKPKMAEFYDKDLPDSIRKGSASRP